MKYIRTEYNIWEVIEETELVYRVRAKNKKNIYSKSKCNTIVNGLADTIEELCDLFVLEKNDYFEYATFKLFTTVKTLKLESIKNKEVEVIIYGAIWTDWGLKYIAKLNEKGELELC